MSKGENIVKWIKGQRVSWLGHLERMEEDRMPKKIFTQELEGTRRRGRPRKGWKEEVERDLQVLGVRRWRELVSDRKKMEGYFSTGQSPQWAVVPMEEEEVFKSIPQIHDWKETQQFMLGEGVDKQLKRDVDGVNPRDLPGSSADNSNNVILHCS